MKSKKDIRQEMKTISGAEFKEWYHSLTKEEKIEYDFLLENLKNPTPPKENIQDIDLGEAINFWITENGSLDLDTPEDQILNFYLKNKK
jgi:hypothetical protein